MRGFTARNTPCMGIVDRRPVVCRNLAMGFWVPLQYSDGCIFFTAGRFGHVQAALFYNFRPFSPFLGAGIFMFFGRFGHIQAVALLSFLAVLAMFRRLHFYYFRLFWPCSGYCIFIISGSFGHVQAAAFVLLMGIFSMFRQLRFHYFCHLPPVRSQGHVVEVVGSEAGRQWNQ